MTRRHEDSDQPLPTPRMYLHGPDLAITCNACLHSTHADMAALVAAGKGDVPLIELRFRCAKCGSRDTFSAVTGVGPSSSWRGF